ncbi:hypothetical protein [Leeuwenhoekiella marinoflava]|uniref:Uncharacterized protein n=2 Tax=Leeuwenhoekiella marinoflava TaxID=988 RepID=A0A4Q0PIG3_9FLAO|nr:hypothetical protein [Leeuwenhoekiella marinoflava]RXG26882.1 hypothetical protein DSL99_3192 [Leeuwenhoekiella marinoflava]SHF40104.1 hypothetical protein SAMN02745246_02395 [Leeuwenhoekiella marinoflava DSM 3653]
MFSTGQWVFAAVFFIAFVIFISRSYRKDRKLHKKEYKGSFWILIGFLVFVGILFLIKITLNK